MNAGELHVWIQVASLKWRPFRNEVERSGFSLIELIVVLIIMALLAGLASTTLRSHLDQSRIERAFQQLVLADALARRQANDQASREVSLRIDGDSLVISPSNRSFEMPDTFDLSLEKAGNASFGNRISFSKSGRSVSYAIRIEAGDREHWLLVLGATGQRISTTDGSLVRRLLQ
ncbi:MAG: type II secretion system protein [Planctomycetota bacterium]